MSVNIVCITGNLTRDPELRSTSGGTSVLKMGVAVNERRKNQQTGEWEDVPNFVDVTIFGKRAEALSSRLSKGAKVAIEGRLRWSQWESQSGEKRSKLEVVADEVEFLTVVRDGGNGGTSSGGHQEATEDYEGEIPFHHIPRDLLLAKHEAHHGHRRTLAGGAR